MALPELFPPPGFYRIDEAYRRWMEAIFGKAVITLAEMPNARSEDEFEATTARLVEIDNARLEFTAGLRDRRESVNVISPSGTRHEIPDTAWDSGEFPDLLPLYKTIPVHAPKPFGDYAGGIIVIDIRVLDEWAKAKAPATPEDKATVANPVTVATKNELEAAYRERAKNWPKKSPNPTFEADWAFLKGLNPSVTRDRARAIRKAFSPPSWKKDGRRIILD